MRVWNITDQEIRKAPFEPSTAEVFDVQGRRETRTYTAVAPHPEVLETGRECEFCDFGRRRHIVPICKVARVLCRAEERKDKRQVVFQDTILKETKARG